MSKEMTPEQEMELLGNLAQIAEASANQGLRAQAPARPPARRISFREGLSVRAAGGAVMEVPECPFVALFGNYESDDGTGVPWRDSVIAQLHRAHVPFFDPYQVGWEGIDSANGDAVQSRIDALVAHEHRALAACACAIVHLVRPDTSRAGGDDALASRFELGFLARADKPTYVVLGATVRGRNYLRAALRARIVADLDEAVRRAVAFMQYELPWSVRP